MPIKEEDLIVYIKASQLKYNREDLFDNTPVFPYPMMGFNEGAKHPWRIITQALMSPIPEDQKRFHSYIEASQLSTYKESDAFKK